MSPYAIDPYVADFVGALLLTVAVIGAVAAGLPWIGEHARRRAVGPHRRGLDALARITRGDHR
jgi:hypothetical protein